MKNDIVVHSRLLVSTVEYIKCVEKIGHAFEGGQGLGIIWRLMCVKILLLLFFETLEPFTFINNHVLISHKVEIKHFTIHSMIYDQIRLKVEKDTHFSDKRMWGSLFLWLTKQSLGNSKQEIH